MSILFRMFLPLALLMAAAYGCTGGDVATPDNTGGLLNDTDVDSETLIPGEDDGGDDADDIPEDAVDGTADENATAGGEDDGLTGDDEADLLEVQTRRVNYYGNVSGFLAVPEEPGDYPGVVMIHEWWGLNENIEETAAKLSAQGYSVLAVDLFDGNVASTPEEARSQVQALDQDEALSNLRAAIDYLREETGAEEIASLGWCFGGGQSMQLALSGEDLDATVIYYGNLVTDQENLTRIGWPVLGIFGAEDQSIPVDDVMEFNETLEDLGVEKEIYVYEGVGHAFANPSGDNFAPDETADAWDKTLSFLRRNLKED